MTPSYMPFTHTTECDCFVVAVPLHPVPAKHGDLPINQAHALSPRLSCHFELSMRSLTVDEEKMTKQ